MEYYLIIAGIIIILSLFMEKISKLIGVPTILLFLVMGIVFGNIGFFQNAHEEIGLIESFSMFALIFIMFFGGFGTNTNIGKNVFRNALTLASVGVFFTVAILALFLHFVLKISIGESFLIASILGSTDAASVFSILRNKNLSLKNNTDSLLEIESGSNDPFAYICTLMAILNLQGNFRFLDGAIFLLQQVLVGGIVAYILSKIFIRSIRAIIRNNGEVNQIIFIGIAILAYSLADVLGGNGYLATYFVGVSLGKEKFDKKPEMVHFFDGVTSLMQLLLFFQLGLLIIPKNLLANLWIGLAILIVITFVARIISVGILLRSFKDFKSTFLISFAGIRGAASIVFAISAVNSGVVLENDIYHIIAVVVFLSLILQGSLLAFVSRITSMLEKEGNILKTFNDYVENKKLNFIESVIDRGSPWKNKYIKDLNFPTDIRMIMINRNGKNISPFGDLHLEEGDKVLLIGHGLEVDHRNIKIKQTEIWKGHTWNNKKIKDISLDYGYKLILIERDKKALIPSGEMTLREDDLIIMGRII